MSYGLSIIGLIVTISILFIVIFCNTRSTKSRMVSYKVVYKQTLDFGIPGVLQLIQIGSQMLAGI
jgi:hypothetical protein